MALVTNIGTLHFTALGGECSQWDAHAFELIDSPKSLVHIGKIGDQKSAFIGSVVNYKVTIEVDDSFHYMDDATYKDPLPANLELVPDSVTVDGVAMPGATIEELPLGKLEAGSTTIITYSCTVVEAPNP